MIAMESWREELYHHGILGQRWGKKNGPPYPLDASDHSSSEKKAGWRKSLDGSNKSKSVLKRKTEPVKLKSEKKGLTDKQKTAIKVGVAVGVTVLAAYGGYRLYKSGKLDVPLQKGKDIVSDLVRKNGESAIGGNDTPINSDARPKYTPTEQAIRIAEATGLPLKTEIFSAQEDSQIVYKPISEGLKRGEHEKWDNCCPHAATSWILRRLGIDCTTKPMGPFDSGGLSNAETFSAFKNVKQEKIKLTDRNTGKEYMEALSTYINKQYKDGAIGYISLNAGPRKANNSGHFFVFAVENGTVIFENPAQGKPAYLLFDEIVSEKWSKYISVANVAGLDVRRSIIKEFVEAVRKNV